MIQGVEDEIDKLLEESVLEKVENLAMREVIQLA